MATIGTWRKVGGTLLVGAVGVVAARALSLPGGAFTGAMLATAIASLLQAPLGEPPKWLRSAARVVLGLTVGASVTPDTLGPSRGLVPVAIMVVAMVALNAGRAGAEPPHPHGPGAAPAARLRGPCRHGGLPDLGGNPPVVHAPGTPMSVLLFVPAFVAAAFAGAAAPWRGAAGRARPPALCLAALWRWGWRPGTPPFAWLRAGASLGWLFCCPAPPAGARCRAPGASLPSGSSAPAWVPPSRARPYVTIALRPGGRMMTLPSSPPGWAWLALYRFSRSDWSPASPVARRAA